MHKAAVGPVQHGEPGDLTASLQCGPVHPFQRAADVRRVPVSAKHKTAAPRCNASTPLMSFPVWGSRTEEAYSSSGH